MSKSMKSSKKQEKQEKQMKSEIHSVLSSRDKSESEKGKSEKGDKTLKERMMLSLQAYRLPKLDEEDYEIEEADPIILMTNRLQPIIIGKSKPIKESIFPQRSQKYMMDFGLDKQLTKNTLEKVFKTTVDPELITIEQIENMEATDENIKIVVNIIKNFYSENIENRQFFINVVEYLETKINKQNTLQKITQHMFKYLIPLYIRDFGILQKMISNSMLTPQNYYSILKKMFKNSEDNTNFFLFPEVKDDHAHKLLEYFRITSKQQSYNVLCRLFINSPDNVCVPPLFEDYLLAKTEFSKIWFDPIDFLNLLNSKQFKENENYKKINNVDKMITKLESEIPKIPVYSEEDKAWFDYIDSDEITEDEVLTIEEKKLTKEERSKLRKQKKRLELHSDMDKVFNRLFGILDNKIAKYTTKLDETFTQFDKKVFLNRLKNLDEIKKERLIDAMKQKKMAGKRDDYEDIKFKKLDDDTLVQINELLNRIEMSEKENLEGFAKYSDLLLNTYFVEYINEYIRYLKQNKFSNIVIDEKASRITEFQFYNGAKYLLKKKIAENKKLGVLELESYKLLINKKTVIENLQSIAKSIYYLEVLANSYLYSLRDGTKFYDKESIKKLEKVMPLLTFRYLKVVAPDTYNIIFDQFDSSSFNEFIKEFDSYSAKNRVLLIMKLIRDKFSLEEYTSGKFNTAYIMNKIRSIAPENRAKFVTYLINRGFISSGNFQQIDENLIDKFDANVLYNINNYINDLNNPQEWIYGEEEGEEYAEASPFFENEGGAEEGEVEGENEDVFFDINEELVEEKKKSKPVFEIDEIDEIDEDALDEIEFSDTD